ncbi:MAG: hypothetical protein GEU26_18075 [Nitrososphaeraceae archaeon]|nr:hypothetical protein [Nitrososphaeraceae archaeon]
MTTLGLILIHTISISSPALSQTALFTTASTRGFFDLDTGEELQPPAEHLWVIIIVKIPRR